MPQSDFLSSLVINKVDTADTLDAMDVAGLVHPNELYLVEEGDFSIVLDEQPTEGSSNLVSSGGIYQAIQNIPTPDVSGQIQQHNEDASAHADIRQAVTNAQSKADTADTKAANAANAAASAQSTANTANANATNTDLVKYINGALKTIGGTSIESGGAKIETGSYAGTGTYGSSNPNSLTFCFEPKVVAVYGYWHSNVSRYYDMTGTSGADNNIAFIPMSILTTSYTSGIGFTYRTTGHPSCYMKKSADGKTISWYHNNGATEQCNDSEITFYYMAIG